MNRFDSIDAQDAMSRMVQLSPEEMAEYDAYLAEVNSKWDKDNL